MILTWLYAPGDRPEVVAKALRSGADAVIVDLEDAVSASRKEYARAATAELLTEPPPVPVHVRVNALASPWAGADLTALAKLPGLAGLRLPKVSAPEQIAAVAERTGGVALYALLESALGVERAYDIARAHPALRGLSLGEADLRADLGVTIEAGLDWPRSRVVVAARAAGLAPPAQSVFPDIRDLEALAVSCARGRALGFLGRSAIHPRQLPVIERAYLPGPEEVAAAEEIVAAARRTPGAVALADGRFVDPAVLAGAERVVSLARREAPVPS
ncbi:HpcH/HpaI aldolase/citrate lyase family protein [Streptomyces sp. MJM1172]|uniref:HpcH/HpaI aldolase/citrate lyase family protein n=1 Tax=Streptomyces sp. MJM1172 TaxID=1703926 RepID=UPI00093AC06A|nr:CoA ester lyase [Streptomyces sp. MJM1172]OKI64096.1 citrate lyase subunit beta [Streptomyces sp. MJM1172]